MYIYNKICSNRGGGGGGGGGGPNSILIGVCNLQCRDNFKLPTDLDICQGNTYMYDLQDLAIGGILVYRIMSI